MSADEYLKSLNGDMEKVLDQLRRELVAVRTGRATPALIENVQVYVGSYGSNMSLKELGGISTPDARLLAVSPWDKSTIQDIMKGILSANLGLTPSTDGQIIRIPIPPLTNDRRKELVKQVGKIAEENRVRLRNTRRDYNDIFKTMKEDGDLTEDELKRALEKVQKTTDSYIAKVDEISANKEKEVMAV